MHISLYFESTTFGWNGFNKTAFRKETCTRIIPKDYTELQVMKNMKALIKFMPVLPSCNYTLKINNTSPMRMLQTQIYR